MVLVTYNPKPDKNICSMHEIDHIDLLNNLPEIKKPSEYIEINNVSVAIASAVTSYSSSIYMTLKKYILKKEEIHYMDTDSIVTNIELPEYIKGNKLGQFILDYKILRAYFMSFKTYCLIVKYGHE